MGYNPVLHAPKEDVKSTPLYEKCLELLPFYSARTIEFSVALETVKTYFVHVRWVGKPAEQPRDLTFGSYHH